jgi:predicted extracellular nuclease
MRMSRSERFWRLLTIAALLVSALNMGLAPASPVSARQLSVATFTGSAYSQNFNSLATTGPAAWTNDSTLSGWYLVTDLTPNVTTYQVSNGSLTTGGFYSFGTTSASDRALGGLASNGYWGASGVGKGYMGLALQNTTGLIISELAISYTGEQWRNGGNTSAQSLVFEYKTSASAPADASAFNTASTGWTAVSALDFIGPITGTTAVALDGNLTANRVNLSSTITGLSVPNNEYILLRWMDLNDSGNDHGLAIDDLSITATTVAALPELSIDDVMVTEGDTGQVTATFTVSLSEPAPVGGVTFDITTQDDTATTADNDYDSQSLSGQLIDEGETTYIFDVLVNGDTDIEADETFKVVLSNASGATIIDDTGIGTITNDDFPTYSLSIDDVSELEGDSGTTIFSFTVSLSNPAPAGGVSFDIATADNTALVAEDDYEANEILGALIDEGETSYTFDVIVYGDTDVEPDETFYVNLSNATVATIMDGQGVGTIQNDDLGIWIDDISLDEGNTGATTVSFTVTLSDPAPAGGVTFDIATADGTATEADGDYDPYSVSGATIAEGETTYIFDVLVYGDWDYEADEVFYVNLDNVSGATIINGQATATIRNDDASTTPICTLQGSGAATPWIGVFTIQGVVVGDFEGGITPQIRGFYVQQENCDGDPQTSDGIFVYNGDNKNQVALGDLVRVTGTIGEYQGQTQLSGTLTVSVLDTGYTVTPTDISLPFASEAEKEQYEGMLVRFNQTLTVTEIYQLGRFGQVTLSNGKLWQPTGVALPGAPALAVQAANDLNKIILDDSNQSQNPDPIVFGRGGNPLSASNTLRGGDTVSNLTGVLVYTWGGNSASPNAYRILPIKAMGGGIPNFADSNPRPATPPTVGGSVKVVGMNLLNYYNTFTGCTNGVGGIAASCRGANNLTEFDRQWPKTVAAMVAMNADVYGVVEMENDGYGPTSAIQDLVNKLNAATAPDTFAFVDADARTGKLNALGTDGIKVGLIYKPGKVNLVGTTAVLDTVEFVNGGDSAPRNRVSLLQAFEEIATGEVFLVNVNHLKSKGSACDDPDAGDGQGNCNIVRTNAALELIDWLANDDPTGTGDPDILILGDLNSYAKEDPITAFKNAGYVDLGNHFGGATNYSYVFDGQWGYLDYALASPSILAQVTESAEWHINADEPTVLDYNTEYKTTGQLISLYAPDQYRIADHDPVIVGLALDSESPSVLSISRKDASPTNSGSVAFEVTFSEDVLHVDATDFALTTDGSLAGTQITGVSGSGTTYTVTVDTGTGSGTLRLDVDDTSDISDATGNKLIGLPYTTGETYEIDKTAPTVVSIERAAANPTNAASVTFTVTFSESVSGVSTSDFSATATGLSGASVSGVSGSGTTYTVTVSTGTGNGTLRLDVPTSATINDPAGNALGSLPYTDGETYEIDKTAPTVVSIQRTAPNPINAASVTFTVTFSEAVDGLDVNDFSTTNTGSLTGTSVLSLTGSGTTYTVTVSTGTGSGTLRLDIPAGATISDLAGNALGGLPYTGGQTYNIRTQTFVDVPVTYWAWSWIERLYAAGVTGGCGTSPLIYCPEAPTNRAQMAIFLLKAKYGAAYNPPAVGASTGFSDVPTTHWAAAWIKQLAAEGITAGFPDGTFRPNDPVSRAQMAVFLLKAKYGAAYNPPAVGPGTGFNDVPNSHWAAAWIKQLAAEEITSGCGGGNYCPDAPVTRAQMAVFLVKTFNLP